MRHFVLPAGLLLVAVIAGCEQTPSPLVPTEPLRAAGPAGRLPIVHVRIDAPEQAQGAVTRSLATALERVRPGGTIRVYEGTFSGGNLRIDKPVTIEAASNSGRPVLDAMGGYDNFWIEGVSGGAVMIRGLALQGAGGQNIVVSGANEAVEIHNTSFYPPSENLFDPEQADFAAGVAVWFTSGGTVRVEDNAFIGGAVGVHGHAAHDLLVLGNIFRGQSNVAVQVGGSPDATARIAGNTVSECGPIKCVAFYDGSADLVGNTITVDMAHPVTDPITGGGRRAVVRDNVIRGVGGSLDPEDPATWPIRGAGIGFYRADEAVVDGNRVTRARAGIWFDETYATGRDNVVDEVHTAVGVWVVDGENVRFPSRVTLARNDFTRYAEPFPWWSAQGLDGESSLRCNWWGTSTGPTNADVQVDSGLYAPWATSAVANGAGGACNGTM